ncbi:MAG: acetyl-CoA carboxylase carboxyltransferase subunit alpha [Nitrospinae bacterium]|nr:acetyl-CoA carboxylase carboxyltransferase subunit alpha [Nitrospinota bacterium]
MVVQILDFESPMLALEGEIERIKEESLINGVDRSPEIRKKHKKLNRLRHDIFSKLTAWQRTRLARHPLRPYTLDYIRNMTTGFIELHGDRAFGDCNSIVGGFTMFDGSPVMVIGNQKGRTTGEKIHRNFGMGQPEGYRKALRLMKMAEKFRVPVITLLDTPGAYPGVGAEERGQSEAIARNLFEMSSLKIPIICVVIGEGGSGGALALGVGNRTLMLENSVYSVISPEGCAAILWSNAEKVEDAAEALGITPKYLLDIGLIDEIVKEPLGGAHRDHDKAAHILRRVLRRHLMELGRMSPRELVEHRRGRFRRMGDLAVTI